MYSSPHTTGVNSLDATPLPLPNVVISAQAPSSPGPPHPLRLLSDLRNNHTPLFLFTICRRQREGVERAQEVEGGKRGARRVLIGFRVYWNQILIFFLFFPNGKKCIVRPKVHFCGDLGGGTRGMMGGGEGGDGERRWRIGEMKREEFRKRRIYKHFPCISIIIFLIKAFIVSGQNM